MSKSKKKGKAENRPTDSDDVYYIRVFHPDGSFRFVAVPSDSPDARDDRKEIRKAYIKDIADHYGRENQAHKAIEECGELIAELARLKDERFSRKGIITEIADVQIMCIQLRHLFDCEEEVEAEIDRKIERTLHRIKEE